LHKWLFDDRIDKNSKWVLPGMAWQGVDILLVWPGIFKIVGGMRWLGITPSLYFRLMIGGIADEPDYLHICEDAGGWRSGGGDRQPPAEPR